MKRKYIIIIGVIILILALIATRLLFDLAIKYPPGSDSNCLYSNYYTSSQKDYEYQTNSNI